MPESSTPDITAPTGIFDFLCGVAFALSVYSLCEVSISIFGPVCYLAGRHSTQFIHIHSIAAEFFLVSYFQVLNPTFLRFSFTIVNIQS
jgi:hypothetical protein